MRDYSKFSIPRYCFANRHDYETNVEIVYELHGFCDASNSALSCVVYLRRIVNGQICVSNIQGKVYVILVNQVNWVIARKKLEAAKMCAELMLQVYNSLRHLASGLHFWSDSQVVLKWILNPDLHLARFVKCRVDRIHLFSPANAWKYVNTTLNPADVGTS